MKLVNIEYGIDINLIENKIYELVIENRSVFSDIVSILLNQVNGMEGKFVLSDTKSLKIEKSVDILIDYYSLSINNKKIINRLYSNLEKITENFIEEKSLINSKLVNVLDYITTSLGCSEVIYNMDFNWIDIFKIYDMKFDESYDNLLDKLISYIKIISEFTDIKIIFFVNLKSYLDINDLNNLYDMMIYYKIIPIMLEPTEGVAIGKKMRYIIDNDRCFIDLN